MAKSNAVLRTFYVDEDIDDAMCAWVGGCGFSSQLFGHWLSAGMRSPSGGTEFAMPSGCQRPPILRTAWIDARVDSELRRQAFHSGVPKNSIAMHYLRIGRIVAPPLKRVTNRRALRDAGHQITKA